MTFKILSCDGGGIRGLITALLIQDLDRRSQIIARADGFAGTSTGGLIALGLANGVSISEIVDIYRTKGSV
ncbi:patatin-like phospholipase family protein, partial [Paraburkholderia sp. SIMBA_050]